MPTRYALALSRTLPDPYAFAAHLEKEWAWHRDNNPDFSVS